MLLLEAQGKDLGGGFLVRRVLPALARQAAGPFMFFNPFGLVQPGPADEHDVKPQPHVAWLR